MYDFGDTLILNPYEPTREISIDMGDKERMRGGTVEYRIYF
jgi:hypothetical protein